MGQSKLPVIMWRLVKPARITPESYTPSRLSTSFDHVPTRNLDLFATRTANTIVLQEHHEANDLIRVSLVRRLLRHHGPSLRYVTYPILQSTSCIHGEEGGEENVEGEESIQVWEQGIV